MFLGIPIVAWIFANFGELFRPFCCTRNGTRYRGNYLFLCSPLIACLVPSTVEIFVSLNLRSVSWLKSIHCWYAQTEKHLLHLQIKSSYLHCSLQLIDSYFILVDDISALTMQAWLARTIQKLDTHLLGVCQIFNEENYLTVSVLKNIFMGSWRNMVIIIYLFC
jgi:hypothetical protein